MSRKKKEKKIISPDSLYDNVVIAKFINQVMRRGKKDIIKTKTQKEPLEVFDLALKNVKPLLEVKSKRIGGATYQVPKPVPIERGMALAMRWILNVVRAKKGKSTKIKLAEELINAANNIGSAVKKKEDTHRMAEANRAFAHFAW
ncbi:MAG: 30S ribosomal protein S7 [Candidatus Nealsonbacteria bacterium]|nr:30S ribosomal protein S7 [Candidatus Nealsonbacteria bacterium]